MKNAILLLAFAAVHLQSFTQTQLMIDPPSSMLQLNTGVVMKVATNDYVLSGVIPNGSDFGMVSRFSSSQILWSNYFSTTYLSTMTKKQNGNFFVGGERFGKAFVSELDMLGLNLWITNISSSVESVTSININSSGEVYSSGSRPGSGYDQFLTKLSPSGTIIWNKHPVSSLGVASYSRIILQGDSVLLFNDPISGLAGDIELRVLDQNCVESFHRTYGIPGNIREALTSVIRMPSRYVIATSRPGALGLIVLDQNFAVVKSSSYTTPGANLQNGKLLYEDGAIYLACDRDASNSPRSMVLKIDTSSLGIVWSRTLSSVNSSIISEPFVDGSLRVPYTRYPTISGSARGAVLASLDQSTGVFTGLPCEIPAGFSIVVGTYTGLVETNQTLSLWEDLVLSNISPPDYLYFPLRLEDCELGTLPIELIHFSGEVFDETKVNLRFVTSSEHSVLRFDIERSTDLLEWEGVETLNPVGLPGVATDYNVVDDNPKVGEVNYYRLRETTSSLESRVFKPISIAVPFSVNFYPNPVESGQILTSRFRCKIEIRDVLGREIVGGFSPLLIDLPAGNYVVFIEDGGGGLWKDKLVVVE